MGDNLIKLIYEEIRGIKRHSKQIAQSLEKIADNSGEVEKDLQFLEALRAAGVDNWEGYDQAKELVEEWNKEGV